MATNTDYGTDTSCTTSLRPGRLSTGALLIAEAAFRRITTPPGSLIGGEEEANYGIDITGLLGAGNVRALASSLPGRIAAELLKDSRIDDVDVSLITTTDGPRTEFTITIKVKTGVGPFTLKVGVDEVTTSLLGISTEDE